MKDVTFRGDNPRVNELRGHFEDIGGKNRYRKTRYAGSNNRS